MGTGNYGGKGVFNSLGVKCKVKASVLLYLKEVFFGLLHGKVGESMIIKIFCQK